MKQRKNIYLDYASATPVDEEVLKHFLVNTKNTFGNPSSIHSRGLQAEYLLSRARKLVSQIIQSREDEVYFTAGGTEANNLAILGSTQEIQRSLGRGGRLLTTKIEHPSVRRVCERVASDFGWKLKFVDVDATGHVDAGSLPKLLEKYNPDFLSIGYVNSEIGVIQNIPKIGRIVKKYNREFRNKSVRPLVFHSDASGAAGITDIRIHHLGVNLLTLNGSKIYGMKQTGCLFVSKDTRLLPIFFGGGQEGGLRSGTENPAGAFAFAEALQKADARKEKEAARLSSLSRYALNLLEKTNISFTLNGPEVSTLEGHAHVSLSRLPGHVSIVVPGIDGELLVLYMDANGVQVSTGNACSLADGSVSDTLRAVGKTAADARSTIRLSCGSGTTKNDIKTAIIELVKAVKLLSGTTQEL